MKPTKEQKKVAECKVVRHKNRAKGSIFIKWPRISSDIHVQWDEEKKIITLTKKPLLF